VWEWKEKSGGEIVKQMKRLGSSCDWSRSMFTMDPKYVEAVQKVFIDYFEKGYIYRGNRIVNWCGRCASVISDLEVEHEEQDTKLVTLRYPLVKGEGFVEVATTRPETMLGDTAVAVNPDDERYLKLVGEKVKLPITGREVPVVADERVDKEFGTGAVKVTPAHDPLDAAIGETHKLVTINVIGEDGKMTAEAGDFVGLEVAEAREKVLARLKEEEAVVNEEDYRHNVALCSRCHFVIEPLISRQWFVKMDKLKDEAIEVGENGVVEFLPERWKKYYLSWMEEVHDWTISRQLWWGQQVPVWWKKGVQGTENEEGNFAVSAKKPEGDDWEQDPDVLDTWFSSALWPMVTLGWPENTEYLQGFYPTTVLITARDIVSLWVARMIFSGLELMKGKEYELSGKERTQAERIPFEQVLIHATVLAKNGARMSKSLGTGIDPLKLIDEYGADATRFGLVYQMNYDSQAVKFDEEAIKMARNFANKLWNLAKFVDSEQVKERMKDEKTVADEAISAELEKVSGHVNGHLDSYKIGEAARELYGFVWGDFADWYIEVWKQEGSGETLQHVFVEILRLLHPIMPHITEVIWQELGQEGMLTQHGQSWRDSFARGESANDAEVEYIIFKEAVEAVRSMRTLLDINPKNELQVQPEHEIPLAKSFEKMSGAKIVVESKEGAVTMPIGGWSIKIWSEEITEKSKGRARERLEKKLEEIDEFVDKQDKVLEKMYEHGAAEEDIVAKQQVVEKKKQERKVSESSLSLLKRLIDHNA